MLSEKQTFDYYNKKESKLFSDEDLLRNIITSKLIKLSGSVVSPGYFPIGGTANINSIISTAGGYTSDADPERIEIQRIDLNKINNNTNFAEPGDIVFVHSSNLIKNNIKILGSIEVERQIGFKANLYLGDIINDLNDFEDETYLHFAVVNRKKTIDKSKKLFVFSPEKVVFNGQNILLKKGDEIKLFTKKEIMSLVKNYAPSYKSLTPSSSLSENIENNTGGTIGELIRKFTVDIRGAVEIPGLMPLGSYYNVNEIINMAGGFTENADKKNISLLAPQKNKDGNLEFFENKINFSSIQMNTGIYPDLF